MTWVTVEFGSSKSWAICSRVSPLVSAMTVELSVAVPQRKSQRRKLTEVGKNKLKQTDGDVHDVVFEALHRQHLV